MHICYPRAGECICKPAHGGARLRKIMPAPRSMTHIFYNVAHDYGGVYWTKILRSELDEESLGELGKAWEHHGSRSVTRVPPVSRGFLACHKLSLPFPSHQPSRSVPSPSPGLPPFPNPQIHSLSILTSAIPKDSRRLPPSPRTLVSGDRASSAFGM